MDGWYIKEFEVKQKCVLEELEFTLEVTKRKIFIFTLESRISNSKDTFEKHSQNLELRAKRRKWEGGK